MAEYKSKLGEKCEPIETLIYDNPEWLIYLRDHINKGYVRTHASIHQVEAITAYVYQGDFFGYLRHVNADTIGDWVHLEINGMTHPSEWDETFKIIYLLPNDWLRELYLQFTRSGGKK